jgi:aromatic ring-cleaving dioxygenase
MKQFHAHIYFEPTQARDAKVFLLWLKNFSSVRQIKVQGFYESLIGPHPLPMFELHFSESEKLAVTKVLAENRKNFSILIHEDTGDDHRDHSELAEWLGPALKIDFDFFEKILQHPELRVHPLISV